MAAAGAAHGTQKDCRTSDVIAPIFPRASADVFDRSFDKLSRVRILFSADIKREFLLVL